MVCTTVGKHALDSGLVLCGVTLSHEADCVHEHISTRKYTATGNHLSSTSDCQTRVFGSLGGSDAFRDPGVVGLGETSGELR